MTQSAAGQKAMLLSEAADQLAEAIAGDIDAYGEALVVWSGGASPRRLAHELSSRDVDWTRTRFLLSDERCAPEHSALSNRGEMMRYLAGTPLDAATIEKLPTGRGELEDAAKRVDALLSRPACASVLGVGADGHIASLFPGGEWSRLEAPAILVFDEHGAGDCARVSLSPAALMRSRFWLVFVNTPEKRAKWLLAAAGAEPAGLPCAIAFAESAPTVRIIDEEGARS